MIPRSDDDIRIIRHSTTYTNSNAIYRMITIAE